VYRMSDPSDPDNFNIVFHETNWSFVPKTIYDEYALTVLKGDRYPRAVDYKEHPEFVRIAEFGDVYG